MTRLSRRRSAVSGKDRGPRRRKPSRSVQGRGSTVQGSDESPSSPSGPGGGSLPAPGATPPQLSHHTHRKLIDELARVSDRPLDLLVETLKLEAGERAAELYQSAVRSAMNGTPLSRRDLLLDGWTRSEVDWHRSRLSEYGIELRFRRGTRRNFQIEVLDDGLARRVKARAKERLELIRLCRVTHKRRRAFSDVPKGDKRNSFSNVSKGSQAGEDTGQSTRNVPKAKKHAFSNVPKGSQTGEDTSLSDRNVPKAKGKRNVPKGRNVPKDRQRRRPIEEPSGDSLARTRGRVPRGDRSSIGKEEEEVPTRRRHCGGGAQRKSVFGNRDELVRLLKLKVPRGSDRSRRQKIVKALGARFNRAYRKAWAKAYGKRPASDYSRELQDLAVWCAIEDVQPADFLETVTAEYSFSGRPVTPINILCSPKARDRFVAAKARPKPRAAAKHAGFGYDYSLEVPDLKRRLVKAGLDGARDLDEKTLGRIEKLCQHWLRGRQPVMSDRIEPFVRYAYRKIYRPRARKEA